MVLGLSMEISKGYACDFNTAFYLADRSNRQIFSSMTTAPLSLQTLVSLQFRLTSKQSHYPQPLFPPGVQSLG